MASQETSGQFTFSVIVADNDVMQSSAAVVEELRTSLSVDITYCCEPEQNISLARNKALEHATAEYVACIDDDEFPEKDWLLTLLNACQRYDADGALGPVRPYFDQPPPGGSPAEGYVNDQSMQRDSCSSIGKRAPAMPCSEERFSMESRFLSGGSSEMAERTKTSFGE